MKIKLLLASTIFSVLTGCSSQVVDSTPSVASKNHNLSKWDEVLFYADSSQIHCPESYDACSDIALGNAEKMFVLASMYQYGKGLGQNSKNANYWYARAASAANSEAEKVLKSNALNNLAHNFVAGEGIASDNKLAASTFEASLRVNPNNRVALYNYGTGLYRGDFSSKGIGISELQKAASLFHSTAAAALAYIYSLGVDVPKDSEKSYFWALLSEKCAGFEKIPAPVLAKNFVQDLSKAKQELIKKKINAIPKEIWQQCVSFETVQEPYFE